MADFKVDENGDIDFTNGLELVTGAEELVQRVQLGLTININEFFTHINYGLPWLKDSEQTQLTDILYFLGDNSTTSEQYIVRTFDEFIESIEGVTSVTSTYSYDRSTRRLDYRPVITGQDGVEIVFPPFVTTI